MPDTFYVKRTSKHNAAGYAFSKALSANQAAKEAAAWESCGETCELVPVTPATRTLTRRWGQVSRMKDAHEIVTFQGVEMTFASYWLNHEEK